MDDIYSNLDNYEDENRLESLENENLELKTKLLSITNDITILQAEYDFLKSEFDKMKANYSSLLKTAKAEIERKTKMITALNAEKDQLIIGFINDSTHKRINSIRYNAKARTTMEDLNKIFKDQSRCDTDTAHEIRDSQHKDNTPNSRKSMSQDQISEPSKDTKRNSTSNTYHNKKDCKENVQVSQHNETPTDQKSNKDVRQERIKQPSSITRRRKTLPALSERSISPQCDLNDKEPISTKSTLKHNSSEVPLREERLKQTKSYNRKYERNHDFERRKEQYESRYNRGRSPHDDRDSRRYGRNKLQERDFRNKYNSRLEYDRRRVLESPPPDLQRTRNRYRPNEHHSTQDHVYEKPRYSEPDHRPPNQRCDAGYDGPTKHRQTRVVNRQADHTEEDNISAKFSEEEESSTSTFIDDRRVNPEPDPRLFSHRYVEVFDNKNNVSTISTVKGRNVDLKLLKYDQNIYVARSTQVTNIDDCAYDKNNSMRTEIRELSVDSGDLFEDPHLGKYRKPETSPLYRNVKSWGHIADDVPKPNNDDISSAHGNYTNKMVMIPENEPYYDRIGSQKLSPEDISSTIVKNQLLNDLSLCPVKRTESKEQNVTSTSEISEDSKLRSALLNKKVVPKFPHATKDIKRCHSVAEDLELSDENSDCNDTMSTAKRDSNIEHDASLGKLQNKNEDESSLITLEDLDLPVKLQSKRLFDIEESLLPIICADSSKSDNSTEIKDLGTSVKEAAPKETIKTETKFSRKRKNKEDLISKDVKKSRSDAKDKKKCQKETYVPKADEEYNRKHHKQTNVTSGKETDKSHRERNSVSTTEDNPKKVVVKHKRKSHEDGSALELIAEPKLKSKIYISKKVEETEKRHEVSTVLIPLDKEKTKRKRHEETLVSKKMSHDGCSDSTKIESNDIRKVTSISTIDNIKTDQQEQSVVESKKNIDDKNGSTKLIEPKKKRREITFVSTNENLVDTTEPSVCKSIIENSGGLMSTERLTDNTKIDQQEQSVNKCNKNIRDDNNDLTKLGEPMKNRCEVTFVSITEKSVATTELSIYKNIENIGDVTANERLIVNTKEQSVIDSMKNIHDNNNDFTKLREPKKKRREVSFVSTTERSVATTEPSVYKNIENSVDVTANERLTDNTNERRVIESKKNIRDDNNDSKKGKRYEVTFASTTENPVATTKPSVNKDIIENRGDVTVTERLTDNTKTDQQEQGVVESKKNIDDNNGSTKLGEPKRKRHEVTSASITENLVETELDVYKNILENSEDVRAIERVTLDATPDISNTSEINLSNNSSSGAIVNSSKSGNPPPDVRIVMKRRRPIMRKLVNAEP